MAAVGLENRRKIWTHLDKDSHRRKIEQSRVGSIKGESAVHSKERKNCGRGDRCIEGSFLDAPYLSLSKEEKIRTSSKGTLVWKLGSST